MLRGSGRLRWGRSRCQARFLTVANPSLDDHSYLSDIHVLITTFSEYPEPYSHNLSFYQNQLHTDCLPEATENRET
jgi:hypothetical protein